VTTTARHTDTSDREPITTAKTVTRAELPDLPQDAPPDRPRPVHARTLDDWSSLLGSMVASLCLVWLLYTQILPLGGVIGFIISWYVAFVAMYAGVTALSQPAPIVRDRIATAVVHGGAAAVGLAIVAVITYTYYRGWPAYHHWSFLSQNSASVGPLTPLNQGGILQAIEGSGIQVGIAISVALPFGLAAAVYMTEVGGKFAKVVRTVIEAMTALPDLVAGLFIYAVLVLPPVSLGRTGMAAALAIAITMTPIIARSSEVVLRNVPSGLREASLALGSQQWRTVWRVVLPTARPGLATALILGVARGIGETAPVLITSGNSNFFQANPLQNQMNSLPLYTYFGIRSGQPNLITRGYGAACVLLTIVLILFVFVRWLATRQSGGER
jgi:phosphate transport system permease protein